MRKILLLSMVAALVVALAPTAMAGNSHNLKGTFGTLAAGKDLGFDVRGVAHLHRADGRTTVHFNVRGLDPALEYMSHLHKDSCKELSGHYQDVPGEKTTPPNELWPSTSGTPLDPVIARGAAGVATAHGTAEWVADETAGSVVIHLASEGTGVANGARVACADLR